MWVYPLYHVQHASRTAHTSPPGELIWDEEDGDDVKLLGIYSSEERAEARIAEARQLPGFSDEPDCFYIVGYIVDGDAWTSGYLA